MRSGIIKFISLVSASVYIMYLTILSMFLSLSVRLYLSVCLSASHPSDALILKTDLTRLSLTSYFKQLIT